jgi:hypothetical protein
LYEAEPYLFLALLSAPTAGRLVGIAGAFGLTGIVVIGLSAGFFGAGLVGAGFFIIAIIFSLDYLHTVLFSEGFI